MVLDDSGQINDEPCVPTAENGVAADHKTVTCYGHKGAIKAGSIVLVDYYVKRMSGAQMIEITPDKFGGSYYLEASTLFRRENDGVDMPAEFIIPNCRVQSNFTFTMAATGDPSTFTFTMDAFPDYTKFDRTHKVLAAIQVINDASGEDDASRQPCRPGLPTRDNAVKLGTGNAEYSFGDAAYAGDYFTDGIDVAWKDDVNGNVYGILNYVECPEFSTIEDEQKGNYFFITLDESFKDKTVTFKTKKDQTGKTLPKDDLQILMRVADTTGNYLSIEVDDKEVMRLNLENLVLTPDPGQD